MSIVDKAIAAVTPPESPEQRQDAHRNARSAAKPGDWLSLILDHHEQIEAAFAAAEAAPAGGGRLAAMKKLGLLLTGHSNAEESVVYPALALDGEKGHATMAYTEQATAKMEMAALENIDPSSQAWLDKLSHIKGAVLHHAYEEESNWFLDLQRRTTPEQSQKITQRFKEEFERYMGDDLAGGAADKATWERSSSASPGATQPPLV
jgi:hypothetical protein